MTKTSKEEFVSYNSSAQHVMGGINKPSWADVLVYILAGIVLISILNFKTLWRAINSSVQTSAVDTSAVIDNKLADLGDSLNHLLDGRVGQMIFWAIVGCVIYMLIWLAQNAVINFRNDVVADKYLHPKSYKSTNYWEGVIAHKIFFGSLLVGFLLYIYLCYSVFIPILSQVFYVATYSFSMPESLFQLFLVFMASGFLVYVFTSLGKLVISSYQAIVNNF